MPHSSFRIWTASLLLQLSHAHCFEHHILPFCPTYLCMPEIGKKGFVSISIPIAYDSRSATLSAGTKKCSFEKSPRCSRRLPTSIFDVVAHFVGLPQEAQPNPTGSLGTVASQLSAPLPAPAHCCPLCESAVRPQAREQSKLISSYRLSQRKVSGILAFDKRFRLWWKHTLCSKVLAILYL